MDLDVTLLFQLALIATLMVILNRTLFAPLLHVIETRHQKIHGLAHEVARLDRLGDADRVAYTDKIRAAHRQALAERESLRAQGREAARQVVAEARAAVAAVHAQSRAQVKASEAAAGQLLQADVAALADQVVHKLLGREQA